MVSQTKSETVVIDDDKFHASEVGLKIDASVGYAEWFAYGKRLGRRYSGIQWAIGDWINHGERQFGEMYAQALDDTMYAYGTLRNYASVCARIPYDVRDPRLLFHQHKHIARLEPDQQEPLIRAAANGQWTGDQVLEAVQTVLGVGKRDGALSYEGVIAKTIKKDDAVLVTIRMLTSAEVFHVGDVIKLKR